MRATRNIIQDVDKNHNYQTATQQDKNKKIMILRELVFLCENIIEQFEYFTKNHKDKKFLPGSEIADFLCISRFKYLWIKILDEMEEVLLEDKIREFLMCYAFYFKLFQKEDLQSHQDFYLYLEDFETAQLICVSAKSGF